MSDGCNTAQHPLPFQKHCAPNWKLRNVHPYSRQLQECYTDALVKTLQTLNMFAAVDCQLSYCN